MINGFLKAMDDNKHYDFIANNYHRMRKEELKDILLEYIYAVSRETSEVKEAVNDNVNENLTAKGVFK